MPNSIKIEYPRASDPPIQVQGAPNNWILPYASGTAFISNGTLTEVSVRTCDTGSSTSCATPKTANTPTLVGVFGGMSVYTWSATNVPVKNAALNPGAQNDALATLVTSAGNEVSPAITFRAVGAVQVIALAAYERLRRVYRVRFDASTLPAMFNRLAALGMNVSNRVKLFRTGGQWKSDDNSWTLDVNGTTATIAADIELFPGVSVTQTWSCPDFHHRLGGVFTAQSIPSEDGTFVPAVVPLNLLVS
jgi:hypothetical protein